MAQDKELGFYKNLQIMSKVYDEIEKDKSTLAELSEQRNPFAETLTLWGFEPHKLVKDMTEEELYKLIKLAVVKAKESY